MTGRMNTTPRRSLVRQAATARKLNNQVRMEVLQGIYPKHIEASTMVDPDIKQPVMRSLAFQDFWVGTLQIYEGEHFYHIRFKQTNRYFIMVYRDEWYCSMDDEAYVNRFVPRIKAYRKELLARKARVAA